MANAPAAVQHKRRSDDATGFMVQTRPPVEPHHRVDLSPDQSACHTGPGFARGRPARVRAGGAGHRVRRVWLRHGVVLQPVQVGGRCRGSGSGPSASCLAGDTGIAAVCALLVPFTGQQPRHHSPVRPSGSPTSASVGTPMTRFLTSARRCLSVCSGCVSSVH